MYPRIAWKLVAEPLGIAAVQVLLLSVQWCQNWQHKK